MSTTNNPTDPYAAPLAQQAATPPEPHAAAYAAWHQWAVTQLGLNPQRAHVAAGAAMQAAARGATPEQAAVAAQQAVHDPGAASAQGFQPVPAAKAGTARRPVLHGVLAILFGVVCLALPLLLDRVFIVLPFLGIAYGVYAIRGSRPVLGIIGIGLNAVAVVVTVLAMVGAVSGLFGR
jgi:hypothetical protein